MAMPVDKVRIGGQDSIQKEIEGMQINSNLQSTITPFLQKEGTGEGFPALHGKCVPSPAEEPGGDRYEPREIEVSTDTYRSPVGGSRNPQQEDTEMEIGFSPEKSAKEISGSSGDPAEVAIESGKPGELGEDKAKEEESESSVSGQQELSEEGQREVKELRSRDREVRAHEHAHVAAGGQYVRGGIQFEYQSGPDGRRYAVGGEVSIDTSPVAGDPNASIQKAQTIRRAALAPAEPSGADRSAAGAASRMESKARKELMEQRLEEARPEEETSPEEAVESLGFGEEADTDGTGLHSVESRKTDGLSGHSDLEKIVSGSNPSLKPEDLVEDLMAKKTKDGLVDVADSTAAAPSQAKLDHGFQPGGLIDVYR